MIIRLYSKCDSVVHFHFLYKLCRHTPKFRSHSTSLNLRLGFYPGELRPDCTPDKVSQTSQINVSITDSLLYGSAHPASLALQLAALEHILLIF